MQPHGPAQCGCEQMLAVTSLVRPPTALFHPLSDTSSSWRKCRCQQTPKLTVLPFLQVFDHVGRATIEPVTQGISGTLFAYGVTSSGKTHTMMGTAADPGLVPRAIQELFAYINQATDR